MSDLNAAEHSSWRSFGLWRGGVTDPAITAPWRHVQQLRIDAAQRLSDDPELDAIEQELRQDLRGRGGPLSWDTQRQQPSLSDALTLFPHHENPEGRSILFPHTADRRGIVEATFDSPGLAYRTPAIEAAADIQAAAAIVAERPRAALEPLRDEQKWRVLSHEETQIGFDQCALSVYHNEVDCLLGFEVLKLKAGKMIEVSCSVSEFDEIRNAQADRSVNAAIRRLFRDHDIDDFGERDQGWRD
eukprot:TRINITY_DN61639_c0_g1_i1.p1 TRINITY_DN61639_c0_g1~~TRINITY_DN61639_c0_g1_i1.p1  ORF type:complete len:244 (-),score=45.80 TRINITY_DN61639_c0_g1_i1:35-766(-)